MPQIRLLVKETDWRTKYKTDRGIAPPDEDYHPKRVFRSSPRRYSALDYVRDNRLRLWFLGVDDHRKVDARSTSYEKVYVAEMTCAVGEMLRLLKPGKCAVLVLGDYNRNGRKQDSAATLSQIVRDNFSLHASVDKLLVDEIPDKRRARRRTQTTKHETIIVIRKLTDRLAE